MTLDSASEANRRQDQFLATARSVRSVWVLSSNSGLGNWRDLDEGGLVVPVWESEAAARECAVGDLGEYEPRSIDLTEFVETHLAHLSELDVWVAVSPTPDQTGNQLPPDRLRSMLSDDA